MKVIKFGGTSLASAEQIKKVFQIVTADPKRRIVVVSAPGKRTKDDIKVTDLLIDAANAFIKNHKADEEIEKVVERYRDIATGLGLTEDIVKVIKNNLLSRLKPGQNANRIMDSMKAAGEDNSARIVAEYFKSQGIVAEYINPKDAGLLLSDESGNARTLPESFQNLSLLREKEGILVFPGFFGYTKTGEIVTFSRGGSDITGSILASAVDAQSYENFTDVDSVFSANPNIVENPSAIEELTYREMRELSYAGFSVLHEEALEPVFHKGIPVCIKNTNNPESKGTKICTIRNIGEKPVVGIASDKGFCSINVSKYMMNREIGFGRRLLEILEDESISYEHTPSGIDNISVILRERQLKSGVEGKIVKRIKEELKVDDISVEHKLALIMVVGEGMSNSIGIAARTTTALAKANINLEMINQGSSEVSMMFGVKEKDTEMAVKSIYGEFFQEA